MGFHKTVSIYKSAIRILGSIVAASMVGDIKLAVVLLALAYGAAEVLGIVEELFEDN